MGSFRRDILIVLAIMAVSFTLILLFGPKSRITFFDLRVLNDTNRTVTVQPCWDLDCIDFHGLAPAVLRPGRSFHSTGHFPTDVGHLITLGIRKPGGKPGEFSSCLAKATAPGQQKGLVRVSSAQACFTAHEP